MAQVFWEGYAPHYQSTGLNFRVLVGMKHRIQFLSFFFSLLLSDDWEIVLFFPFFLLCDDLAIFYFLQTYKWDRLRHWQAEVEEVKQASELKDTSNASSKEEQSSKQSNGRCGWLRCSSCWASAPKLEEKNIYDRGVWKNFVEVFNPRGFKRSAKHVHRKRQ